MNKTPSILNRQVISWSMYDLANTIFSMNILSRYFKPWVVEDLGKDGLYYDIPYAASMLVAGLLMPALGALSDQSAKKKLFLLFFTVSCCLALGIIPLLPLSLFIIMVVLFAASNFFYEGGMVFYNALLYSVAEGTHARLISGFGVAMGYFGAMVGLILVAPFADGIVFGIDVIGEGSAGVFLPTAIIFFILALPTFIWVKEKEWKRTKKKKSIKDAYRDVWEGIIETRKYPGVMRFLIADYFFEDSVATVILNIGVFSSIVLGLEGGSIDAFLITSTVSAMIGSLILGRLAKGFNLKSMMTSIIWGWIVVLILFIFIQNLYLIYVLGSITGILMGGLWTVSRPLLAEMVPLQELGRFFGLYALSGRAAAILGPIIWGTIVYVFSPERSAGIWLAGALSIPEEGRARLPYQLAIAALVIIMMIGLYIFRKVPKVGHRVETIDE